MMEEKVFPRPAVAAELEHWVEARLHTDGTVNIDEIKRRQRELTGSVAIPNYVTVEPETERKLGRFEGATPIGHERFVKFLRESRRLATP